MIGSTNTHRRLRERNTYVDSKSTHIARLGIDRLLILNAQSAMTVTTKPESRINRKRSVNQHTLSSPNDKVDELHTMYVNSNYIANSHCLREWGYVG